VLDTQVATSNPSLFTHSFAGRKSSSLFPFFSLFGVVFSRVVFFVLVFFVLVGLGLSGLAQAAPSSEQSLNQSSAKPEQLTPYSAKYLAFRNGSKIGFAEMDLAAIANNQYRLRFYSDASLFLIYDKREEISVFSVENQQLMPLTYEFDKRGTFKNEQLKLSFQRDKNQIVVNDSETMAWQHELDHQLYRLAAQHRLQAGEEAFEFDLINYRGQAKHYGFKVEGREELTLPFGKLKTIKLKTIRQSKKRVTYSWFAPELNYLLVRMRQFKEGKEQGDIQLSEFSLSKP